MNDVDVVVVGAGVIGLAVARELALDGREVVILEAAMSCGTGISSRNSEVIHAGIYHPRGSLKASSCVAGRAQLYEYCETHGIPHRRCGKLIVATSEAQLRELAAIRSTAAGNGVVLQSLTREEARSLEPELECVGALLSPSTGIVDSHAYMLSLLGEAERRGATIAYGSTVSGARLEFDGVTVVVNGGETELRARMLVNSAGLGAPDLAANIEGFPPGCMRRGYLAKGSYFSLSGHSPFSRLVYPVPEPGGLGVHLTLDIGGRARFGPDVEWVDQLDYDVDPSRGERFYDEVRKYWPGLPDGALEPAYAGIRPKIVPQGSIAGDFVIDGPATHGVRSVVNLFGIESPGLTASLALAEKVAAVVTEAVGRVRISVFEAV